MKPLRAAILVAVSSKKQNAPGTISLDLQEDLAKKVCVEQGWIVVSTLRMAHSRNYTDLDQWKKDLSKTGNNAGFRLFELWEAKAFDVLICHTLDRLGSKMSMIIRVIEETVMMGGTIYVIQDKMMLDQSNYPLIAAVGGYFTTTRMRKVLEVRAGHLQIRAPLGNPAGRGNLKLAYSVERGKTRVEDRLILNSKQQQVWFDAATLFVDQRISTLKIEDQLYQQFGHVNTITGKPYSPGTFYRMLHTPTFWGHTTLNMTTVEDNPENPVRPQWVYDEKVEPPEGIKLFRNTHQPVYTGPLAKRVIAELRRRHEIRGRGKPNTSHPLSAICICNTCHTRLTPLLLPKHNTKQRQKNGIVVTGRSSEDFYLYWRCPTAHLRNEHVHHYYKNTISCDQHGMIRDDLLREQINVVLQRLIDLPDLSQFLPIPEATNQGVTPDELEHQIEQIRTQMKRVIDLQISTGSDDFIQAQYAERLKLLSKQIEAKMSELNILRASKRNARKNEADETAERLRSLNLPDLWSHEPAEINQILLRILGSWRFLADLTNKKTVGLFLK